MSRFAGKAVQGIFETLKGAAPRAARYAKAAGGAGVKAAKAAPKVAKSVASGMLGIDAETARLFSDSSKPWGQVAGLSLLWQGAQGANSLVIDPIASATTGVRRAQDRTVVTERMIRRELLTKRLEAERMQRDILTNAQVLARENPALYNQIMAGRRLARGAVVLGGVPRVDLLREIAEDMAKKAGRSQEKALHDQVMQELVGDAISNEPLGE